jgi:2-dehydropantoate 2-reductase
VSKVCIFGAGAIGGYMAAMMERAGKPVSIVARGPHLAAIQANGLRLRLDSQEEIVTRPRATDNAAELGPQDYVIITLKAHSISGVVDAMQPLLGPETAVVFGVNGVPWWYFYGQPGPFENRRLETVDPGDRIWNGIGPQRAIGCVVYPAAEVVEPGVIGGVDGDRFSVGEPSGEKTERVRVLSEMLIASGLKAPVRPRLREEIWIKLWGNCSLNPVSALTGATLEQMVRDPEVRALLRAIMVEAQTVAEKLGVSFPIDVDKRLAGAEAVGAHKTSMLQDLERGRPMEIDALVSAVQELARLTETPTPALDAVLALVKQRARLAGCYT